MEAKRIVNLKIGANTRDTYTGQFFTEVSILVYIDASGLIINYRANFGSKAVENAIQVYPESTLVANGYITPEFWIDLKDMLLPMFSLVQNANDYVSQAELAFQLIINAYLQYEKDHNLEHLADW